MNEPRMDAFGLLANFIGQNPGGDIGAAFPMSDVKDLSSGARFIPGEVTLARRDGEHVEFVQKCGACCWYWRFEDGSRAYHFDRMVYDGIARANGRVADTQLAGPCPSCGNKHTHGGALRAGVPCETCGVKLKRMTAPPKRNPYLVIGMDGRIEKVRR